MQNIKRITERVKSDFKPYVIEKLYGDDDTYYYLKHYNDCSQIHNIEQTAKGVYITLWICRKDVKIFLSNKDIDIEYLA